MQKLDSVAQHTRIEHAEPDEGRQDTGSNPVAVSRSSAGTEQARGSIIKCKEARDCELTAGKEYVVLGFHRNEYGHVYYRVLGDDNRGHDYLEAMFVPNQPQEAPDTLRAAAIKAADALKIFNGHDSNANLRARYGERWWDQIQSIEMELRSLALTRPK